MASSDVERAREAERRQRFAEAGLHGEGKTQQEAAAVLKTLSEVDDLPIQPEDDDVIGQLISKVSSTANLTEDEVRSNEWVREYILLLYLCHYPTEGGCHGSWRGWAHGDSDAEREPLSPEKRTELETLVTTSKLLLSRSEDAKVIEEGARDVKETHVPDSGSGGGGGGILGRIGLR